jgi:hypothetical protein
MILKSEYIQLHRLWSSIPVIGEDNGDEDFNTALTTATVATIVMVPVLGENTLSTNDDDTPPALLARSRNPPGSFTATDSS